MKIVLVGGHLSPLISVIESLAKDSDLLVIGRKYTFEGDSAHSLEYQMVSNLKIPFVSLTTGRLQRKFTIYTILSLFKLPYGFFKSLKILQKAKPDLVVSFGGYIAIPVAFASYILGIPVIIHEQTLGAGLSNKIVSFFARKVCVSFEQSKKYFPSSKTIVTGNFLRREILYPILSKSFVLPEEKLPVIYITGGSSGAHFINILVESYLKKLLQNYIIIHQTGDAKKYNDFERLVKLKDSLTESFQKRYVIKKFFDTEEVSTVFQKADLVVSRSGINTVTELLYLGIPALLIPLPFSQEREQVKNALFFQHTGLGEVEDQENITPEKLYEKITKMIKDRNKYEAARPKAQNIIKKDAVQKFVNIIKSEIE